MLSRRLDRSSIKLNSFDHVVLRQLRMATRYSSTKDSATEDSADNANKNIGFLALAVSGGMDSMCLMHVIHRLQPLLPLPIWVLHVHHGHSESKATVIFRMKAAKFVKDQAKSLGLNFRSNKFSGKKNIILNSESELRDFRYQFFNKGMTDIQKKIGKQGLLLTAHHWDDLLETRLIRLIRGVGAQGFSSMVANGKICRPLLELSRKDIEKQVKLLKLKYLLDPSNREVQPLRNWIRNDWLKSLDSKRSGSSRRLALSLENLAESLSESQVESGKNRKLIHSQYSGGFLPRSDFKALSPYSQRSYLAEFLRAQNVKAYTRKHIEEIRKRLDTRRKNFTFTLLKMVWSVNAQQISVHLAD